MAQKNPDSAFTTIPTGGIVNTLSNKVGVFSYPTEVMPHSIEVFKAIWDTGATHSVITSKVVRKCRLNPIGQVTMYGVNSEKDVNAYLVDLVLPNSIEIKELKVSESDIGAVGDILIGMDIITLGDFAVSNYQGTTSFTFRMPSLEAINFIPTS